MSRLDFSLGQRLAIGFGVVLVLLLLQFWGFYSQTQRIDAELRQREDIASRSRVAAELQSALFRRAIAARNYALIPDQSHLADFELSGRAAEEALSYLGSLPKTPEGQAIYEQIVPYALAYQQTSNRFVTTVQASHDPTVLRPVEESMSSTRGALMAQVEAYINLQARLAEEAEKALAAAQAESLRDMIILISLIFGASALTALMTTSAVSGPVRRLVRAASALSAGDYEPALALKTVDGRQADVKPGRDELTVLAHAVADASHDLRRREARLAARNRVTALIASSIETERLANDTLRELAAYTHCEIGAVYALLPEDPSRLHRVGAYALDAADEGIRLGEGIPGEAAASGRPVVVSEIPDDTPWRLRTGLADLAPKMVAAFPLLIERRVIGVLLVGALHNLDADALSFIEQSANQLAVALQNAESHRRVAALALELQLRNEELQARNEEIQTQSEELQAQNEEIQSQNEVLQSQNEEIHAQTEELEVQNEQLRETDRLRDEFLALASHELKSPITSIKGYSQLLMRRSDQHPELNAYADILATIDRSSGLLLTRINRLLDVSRARMGKLDMRLEPIDLVAVVAHQIEQASMRTKAHQIDFSKPKGRIVGRWDRAYLEQAVANLVDNAIRYSPDGGEIRVTIAIDEGQAVLAVQDHGIGIPFEEQGRVFETYYRHEAAKRLTGDGLGIGLFMTREIVQSHGGRIWLESTPGEGSTFYFSLPLTPNSLQATEALTADS